MAFNWKTSFRTGQWLALRKFILQERKDVASRIAVIDAELARIGKVLIKYASVTNPDGEAVVSEQRVGLWSQPNTSITKLLQAYITLGGNPFDISMFMYPDSDHEHQDGTVARVFPYGGAVYPKGTDAQMSGYDEAGDWCLLGYRPGRTGPAPAESPGVRTHVEYARRWIGQERTYKRDALELRIIKLSDLAEQLTLEKTETLAQAVSGLLRTVPEFDAEMFAKGLRVDQIVTAMDGVLFEDAGGVPDLDKQDQNVGQDYPTVFPDKPEEAWTAL